MYIEKPIFESPKILSLMMVSWEFSPFFIIFICAIYYGLYVPILLYYLRKYIKYVDVIYISKRHPLVSIIEITSVILGIAINFTIVTIIRTMGPSQENQPLYNILYNLSIFIQPITIYGAFYGLLWRWYDLYSYSCSNICLSQSFFILNT